MRIGLDAIGNVVQPTFGRRDDVLDPRLREVPSVNAAAEEAIHEVGFFPGLRLIDIWVQSEIRIKGSHLGKVTGGQAPVRTEKQFASFEEAVLIAQIQALDRPRRN